jgi:hypothetical protein
MVIQYRRLGTNYRSHLRWCLPLEDVTDRLSLNVGKELEYSWNVMAHGDAREGKWRGNWRMEWVATTLHATSEHGVPIITTADTHTSAASSRLNWRPRRFKWTRPFRRKTKSCFCACAIAFQTQSTTARCVIVQKRAVKSRGVCLICGVNIENSVGWMTRIRFPSWFPPTRLFTAVPSLTHYCLCNVSPVC